MPRLAHIAALMALALALGACGLKGDLYLPPPKPAATPAPAPTPAKPEDEKEETAPP
jgi:predicted small lipoprotein YifL